MNILFSPRNSAARELMYRSGMEGRRKILIVDDDAELRALMAATLSATFAVETADDAKSGESAARRIQPDIILCDYSMPGEDGLTALKRMRNDPALSHASLILMSGNRPIPDTAHTGIPFLAKPFGLERLFAVLWSCMQRTAPYGFASLGDEPPASPAAHHMARRGTLVFQLPAEPFTHVQQLHELAQRTDTELTVTNQGAQSKFTYSGPLEKLRIVARELGFHNPDAAIADD